ncbi:CAP-associated domain-containing protein [Paenibacillus tyrfis]|uniref:CAP-associated domain-containing protein n=1 Tax=Paenibacillus tyrfis TaxID=1501230 RepID=UPI000B59360D|nr:CAP-associated domain-containing protein [Paenibacillus tyrfis]
MNKRWLTYALTMALSFASVFSASIPSNAADASSFTDTSRHWGAETISWAVQNGIVNGYEDGTFRPNAVVSEPEFLAMLLRAYPDNAVPATESGAPWYEPYYSYASTRHWPLLQNTDRNSYNRGHVARLIAATQQQALNLNDSIRYLLDKGLSRGKTAATVEGYKAADRLSRAEAVQFIRNLKQNVSALRPAPDSSKEASDVPAASQALAIVSVKGVAIGDSADAVVQKLGQPARKDASEYSFQWYIYNQDYKDYAQIGVSGGKVVALYSPSANWRTDSGIADGTSKAQVEKQYGRPVSYIMKGNTRFMINYGKGEYGTYEIAGAYVTFFYNIQRGSMVTGLQVIEKPTEQAFASFYPEGSDTLARSFELQSFDLANATRVKLGLQPFVWDDKAAETARKHSQDMGAQGYFDHNDPSGHSPFDRMKQDGITYRAAAENIAAGQGSAIFAHHGWMNSEGHRKNLLSDIKRLGVGVSFGGSMHIYYTQDFYTP